MKPVIVIDTTAELEDLTNKLLHQPRIAVDTESNGFFAYFERICLIQLSSEEDDYIIDPLEISNLSHLRYLFEDARVEKIFHAASNDIMGLKRDFALSVVNLFDTSVAAKILGYKQLGLAAILEKLFGVQLSKKYQRHDWGNRPLGEQELNYARLDTHFLIPLRNMFALELQTKELTEQAQQFFYKACDQEALSKPFRPQDFLNVKGAQSLDTHGKHILKALFVYREHEAKRRNRAPFRIFPNEAMLRLAQQRPENIAELIKVKGIPKSYRKGRNAQLLLQLVSTNEKKPDRNISTP